MTRRTPRARRDRSGRAHECGRESPAPSSAVASRSKAERSRGRRAGARRSQPPTGAEARAVAAIAASARRNGPIRVFATMLVVPAIFGTVALPAYAIMPGGPGFEASGTFSLSVAQAQDVDVSALATGAPLSSDGYAVTTKAEIEEARLEAEAAEHASWARRARLARLRQLRGLPSRPRATTTRGGTRLPDDYGGGLSPLRYYYRECVDFVAWRLNRDAGVTSAPWKWDWCEPRVGQRLRLGRRVGESRMADLEHSRSSARSRGSRTTTSPTCSRSTPTARSTSRSTTRTATTRTTVRTIAAGRRAVPLPAGADRSRAVTLSTSWRKRRRFVGRLGQ